MPSYASFNAAWLSNTAIHLRCHHIAICLAHHQLRPGDGEHYDSNRRIAMTSESRLSELVNIGSTVEQRLNEIGIFTRDDLERIGPSAAYLRIKDNYPGRTLPRCYYLYSLEGALRGVHWDAIPDELKRKLSIDAGLKGK